MKSRISYVLAILLIMAIRVNADCIQNPTSPIDRMGQNFVPITENSICWEIDFQSNTSIRFDYDIDLENGQGSLVIYEWSSNSYMWQPLYVCNGYASGNVSTTVANGKAKIVYEKTNYTEFYSGGFIVSYHAIGTKQFDEYTVRAEQLIVGDKLGIGVDSPTAELHMAHGIIKTNDNDFNLSTSTGSLQINANTNIVEFSTTAPKFRFSQPIILGNTNCGINYSYVPVNNHKLHLMTNDTNRVTIIKNGNVGIGTENPQKGLHVEGGIKIGTTTQSADRLKNVLLFGDGEYVKIGEFESDDKLSFRASRYNFTYGNVGINMTANPTYRLQVNGDMYATEIYSSKFKSTDSITTPNMKATNIESEQIIANEVYVRTSSGADYVFDKDYVLPDLRDVNAYIEQNKHLPEIPSAAEMQTKGVSLDKLVIQLLQKIEELTLYTIQQEERIKELEKLKK